MSDYDGDNSDTDSTFEGDNPRRRINALTKANARPKHGQSTRIDCAHLMKEEIANRGLVAYITEHAENIIEYTIGPCDRVAATIEGNHFVARCQTHVNTITDVADFKNMLTLAFGESCTCRIDAGRGSPIYLEVKGIARDARWVFSGRRSMIHSLIAIILIAVAILACMYMFTGFFASNRTIQPPASPDYTASAPIPLR